MIEIRNRFNNGLIITVDSLLDADLRRADLRRANIPIYCKWNVSFSNDEIQIGCKKKSIEQWDYFFSDECEETIETDRSSEDFKRIKAMYNAYRAYKKTMEDA